MSNTFEILIMLNKCQLIGRLGEEPTIRYMPSGDAIATFSVATTRRWKNKQGEKQEETEWHRVTFFGPVAKVCGDYLKKGSFLFIEGRIKTDKYQKDGVDVYRTGIVGEQMHMLDSKSGGNAQHTEQKQPNNAHQPAQSGGYDDFDDPDIPFNSLNWQIRNHLI